MRNNYVCVKELFACFCDYYQFPRGCYHPSKYNNVLLYYKNNSYHIYWFKLNSSEAITHSSLKGIQCNGTINDNGRVVITYCSRRWQPRWSICTALCNPSAVALCLVNKWRTFTKYSSFIHMKWSSLLWANSCDSLA